MSIRKGSVYIAGNNISIDGDTISYNSNNSLQAIGTINKNSTAVDTIKYDWVGTTTEYTTQNIASLHPEWVCYITDDDASELLNTAWASGLGMPDFMHTEAVTILASGSEYIAPANGWFYAKGQTNSGNTPAVVYLHGPLIDGRQTTLGSWAPNGATGRIACCIYPVTTGTSVEFVYGNSTTNLMLAFIYAEGNGQ